MVYCYWFADRFEDESLGVLDVMLKCSAREILMHHGCMYHSWLALSRIRHGFSVIFFFFYSSISDIWHNPTNRFKKKKSSCVHQLDGMRVEAVVRGYATNAAEILPLQKPARTLLPPLLFCMACEMLSVRLLAPEVRIQESIFKDFNVFKRSFRPPTSRNGMY